MKGLLVTIVKAASLKDVAEKALNEAWVCVHGICRFNHFLLAWELVGLRFIFMRPDLVQMLDEGSFEESFLEVADQ